MRLPGLPNQIQHRPVQTVEFLGLNLTNNTKEGEFRDTLHLTTRNYPYLTQTTSTSLIWADTSDVYVWDREIFIVSGTKLRYRTAQGAFSPIGDVTAGKKQMAVINTKLVIFPDKKYVDLTTHTMASLGDDIPDLDYICSSNNRIWGVSNATNTIYASALGDPTDFTTYVGESGAYAVVVGSEGDFTGICNYGGAVCCWKEDMLHKILGSYPSEYYMVDSHIFGVQKGSEKSLTEINDMLYYKGVHGVYVYGGNQPQSIGYNLGNKMYYEGVGGSDGRIYYLGMRAPAGTYHLYAYDLEHGLWMKEADSTIGAVATLDDEVYLVMGGNLYKKTNSISGSWYGEFVETTEKMFNRKGYTKILLRTDMGQNSTLKVKVKEDRGDFRVALNVSATNKTTMLVPIRLGRCDRFTIRLEGTGEVTIRAMAREHVTGSEIN